MDTDPTLTELSALGLRLARVVTGAAEIEHRALAAAASGIPAADAIPASLEEATRGGLAVDSAVAALAQATPRLAILSQCFDRVARAIRRTRALSRRLEQGWPAPRALSDTRRAMLLRQAIRGTRDTIRAHTEGDAEAAERLFADLGARLDDPAFEQDLLERPIEEITRRLCQAIGLTPEPKPARAAPSQVPRRNDPG